MAAVLFFGSGASAPLGIPTSQSFVGQFIEALGNQQHEREYVVGVRDRLASAHPDEPDLEAVMSVLRMLAAPDFEAEFRSAAGPALSYAFGTGPVYSNAKAERGVARRVFRRLKEYIRTRCAEFDGEGVTGLYDPIISGLLAENKPWAVGGREFGLGAQEIAGQVVPNVFCYTTNYDTALEAYCERKRIPYHRGFTREAGPSILSAFEIRRENPWKIIKLHGSVDMYRLADGSIRDTGIISAGPKERTTSGIPIEGELLIYPVHEKELFEFPFLDFFYDFGLRLRDSPVWCFVGFSFRDDPINRILRREATDEKKMLVIGPSASHVVEKNLPDLRGTVIPIDMSVGDPGLQDETTSQREI